eukprot:scaffold72449_cov30-Tisochrysis_lutea.AAC.5
MQVPRFGAITTLLHEERARFAHFGDVRIRHLRKKALLIERCWRDSPPRNGLAKVFVAIRNRLFLGVAVCPAPASLGGPEFLEPLLDRVVSHADLVEHPIDARQGRELGDEYW